MSRLKMEKILVPALRLNKDEVYQVLQGGSEVLYTTQAVSGQSSLNTQNFTFKTPGRNVVINANMKLKEYLQIAFTGTSVSGNLLQSGCDAPRAFPISRNTTAVTAKIGTNSVTRQNQNLIFDAFAHYMGKEHSRKYLGQTPTMLDQSQVYEIGTRNPMNNYLDSVEDLDSNGFGAPWLEIVSNTPTSAVVRIRVTEPIALLEPFSFSDISESKGFYNIDQISLILQFNFSYQTLWSHGLFGNNITGATVTMFQQPELEICYSTQYEDFRPEYPIRYQLNNLIAYPASAPITVAAGALATYSFQNIQLDGHPAMIFVYAPVDQSSFAVDGSTPYAYMKLENISVQYGTLGGQLAAATEYQLHDISNQNRNQQTWAQWNNQGSVFALVPGKDIGLGKDLAPGVQGNVNILVKATFRSLHPTLTMNYLPIVVTMQEGFWEIGESMQQQQLNVLTKEEVAATDIDYAANNFQLNPAGSGIFETAKKFAKLVSDGIEVGMEVLPLIGAGIVKDGNGLVKSGGRLAQKQKLRQRL